MTFQGIDYDLSDINDRMTLAEKLLADLYRIVTSPEVRSEATWAAMHGFQVAEELSLRNGATIHLAGQFLERVKNV